MKKVGGILIALIAVVSVHAETNKPHFTPEGYIKLNSPATGNRCGALTIKPKSGHNVLLVSTIWSGFKKREDTISRYSGRIDAGDSAGEEFVRLGGGIGGRYRYDWAGRHPKTHYRIYCYTRDKTFDYPQAVKCQDVVNMEDVMFARTCGGVARMFGGTGADYGDLRMNKG